MLWYPMTAEVQFDRILTPGVNWGRPLMTQQAAHPFYAVKVSGHRTWGGRGQLQKYQPTLWMLVHVKDGQLTALLEHKPGSKARIAQEEFKGLTQAWRNRKPRTHVLKLENNLLTSGNVQLPFVDQLAPILELLVRAVVGPGDRIRYQGDWTAPLKNRVTEARLRIAETLA
jgi:hypothetical protein